MWWFFQAVGNCWMLKLGLCVFVSLEVAEKLWLQWLLLNLGKHEGLWVFVRVSGVNCQNWGPMVPPAWGWWGQSGLWAPAGASMPALLCP